MIDMHTHLWPAHQSPDYMADYLKKKKEAGQEISLTGPGLLRSMDHCQIHRAVISVLAFGERFTWFNACGIVLMIVSVLVMNGSTRRSETA